MEKIKFEINNLQTRLLEVILAIEFKDSILRQSQIKAFYPQLDFIERALLENLIIKTATLIKMEKMFSLIY